MIDTSIIDFRRSTHRSPKVDTPIFENRHILEFINLRAQASESMEVKKLPRAEHHSFRKFHASKAITSHAASAMNSESICVVCKTERHPLYACTRFKSLPRNKMMSTIKANDLCVNCLSPGHFFKGCQSLNRCRKCQNPHHTLIHIDTKDIPLQPDKSSLEPAKETKVISNTATGVVSNTLLMTCQVMVKAPDGSSVKARALLDSASSTSFVSECLAQGLCLPRSRHNIRISGVAGLSHQSPLQSVATLSISSVYPSDKNLFLSAIVVPRVTCDLPMEPVHFDSQ